MYSDDGNVAIIIFRMCVRQITEWMGAFLAFIYFLPRILLSSDINSSTLKWLYRSVSSNTTQRWMLDMYTTHSCICWIHNHNIESTTNKTFFYWWSMLFLLINQHYFSSTLFYCIFSFFLYFSIVSSLP